MTSADLETRYRSYLDSLNERRLDDLVHYVQDELSYNGETMTRRQYQDLIAADITAIPDLIFDAQILIASVDHVACRLVFNCTPQHEFLGFSPNGERLCFAEHVFYRFRDGRIAAVWSLIDRPGHRSAAPCLKQNGLDGCAIEREYLDQSALGAASCQVMIDRPPQPLLTRISRRWFALSVERLNVMEHLLDQLNGAIDGIASCLADPIHDEWFQTSKATQTLKEAARRLNDIAHGIQIERDQYLEFMSE